MQHLVRFYILFFDRLNFKVADAFYITLACCSCSHVCLFGQSATGAHKQSSCVLLFLCIFTWFWICFSKNMKSHLIVCTKRGREVTFFCEELHGSSKTLPGALTFSAPCQNEPALKSSWTQTVVHSFLEFELQPSFCAPGNKGFRLINQGTLFTLHR